MSLDNAIFFGSAGMGEVVHATPLLRQISGATLVVREWHRPIFDRIPDLNVEVYPEDTVFRRAEAILPRSFADRIGLDSRPAFSTHMRNGVFIGEDKPKLWVSGVDGGVPPHQPLSGKMMRRYGLDPKQDSDLAFEVSRIGVSKPRVLTLASSGEILRTIPFPVIRELVRRLLGWKIQIISVLSTEQKAELLEANLGRNDLFFMYPSGFTASAFAETLTAVQNSSVVVSTENGWSNCAVASGIKTIILQSHVLFESLIPRHHWSHTSPFVRSDLSCDRQCSAQRILAPNPVYPRPQIEWENYSALTPDWVSRIYCNPEAHYPTTLACWDNRNPSCMSYTTEEIERLCAMLA